MKKQAGFTLIEILIAITIFAIGMLAIAKMQMSSIQGNYNASGMSEAVTLAQGRIEQLMVLDYDHSDLLDTDTDGTNQDLVGNDGIDDVGGGNFGLDDTGASADRSIANLGQKGRHTISWNIAVDEPDTNAKTIRVIVTWQDYGIQRQIAMDSIRSIIN